MVTSFAKNRRCRSATKKLCGEQRFVIAHGRDGDAPGPPGRVWRLDEVRRAHGETNAEVQTEAVRSVPAAQRTRRRFRQRCTVHMRTNTAVHPLFRPTYSSKARRRFPPQIRRNDAPRSIKSRGSFEKTAYALLPGNMIPHSFILSFLLLF